MLLGYLGLGLSVAHRVRRKAAADTLGIPTAIFHKSAGTIEVFRVRTRALEAKFGLETAVQKLVGIELRRVRRHMENLDLRFVLLGPGLYELRMMNSRIVANDEELSAIASQIKDQAMEEANEVVGVYGHALKHEEKPSPGC